MKNEIVEPLLKWYKENKRPLPWRKHVSAYHTWVSEIMLQQTRVEAVKPFYARFLQELPTVQDLAQADEDKILKLWEGLGYYNRVRNMQKAAQQIMKEHSGEFPKTYEEILELKGIGSYTAGAIGSIAYGIPKAAVDGNVLRVISRIQNSRKDIMKASTKREMEEGIEAIIPKGEAGNFNQSLIELGALVCVPNARPKCKECPVQSLCIAYEKNTQMDLPVKTKAKARKIEKRTVLIFKDGESLAIRKRTNKGLLAGLYEFPNVEGHLSMNAVKEYSKSIGLTPIHVQKLENAKHIFSHIEWHMMGYSIRVDELEKSCTEKMLFVPPGEIQRTYPIPSAFEAYNIVIT